MQNRNKMKKFFVIVFLFMVTVAKAEQKVGEFYNSYFKKNYAIEALQKDGKLESVFIGVESKGSKESFIKVEGSDLETFKLSLNLVKSKYAEWVKVAKANHITEMNKAFSISFPKVEIYWLGSKWWSSYKLKVELKFIILDDGQMVALWAPTAKHWNNEYIDETIYFVFSTIEDFDNLIKQLNSQDILNKLLQTKNNEELFQ